MKSMKERTLKKIKKLLAKEGVEESKIESLVADIQATEEGEDDKVPEEESGNPTPSGEEGNPVPPEGASDKDDENVVEKEQGDDNSNLPPVPPETPNEEVVHPSNEEPTNPAPGSIEDALNQLGATQEGGVPPQGDPVPPEVPPVDPQVQELINTVGELKKANEGLLARIGSLEDALKAAGVIEGSQSLGDERPTLPNPDPSDTVLEDVLNTLNRKKY